MGIVCFDFSPPSTTKQTAAQGDRDTSSSATRKINFKFSSFALESSTSTDRVLQKLIDSAAASPLLLLLISNFLFEIEIYRGIKKREKKKLKITRNFPSKLNLASMAVVMEGYSIRFDIEIVKALKPEQDGVDSDARRERKVLCFCDLFVCPFSFLSLSATGILVL